MTEFLFITQTDSLASYRGPSGRNYVIALNKPFKVDNKDDIEFFKKNNTRFKKMGLLSSKPDPIKKDPEVKFSEELDEVKGLSKGTKSKLVELYSRKDDLLQVLEGGYKMDPSISKGQQEKIIKHFLEK